MLRFNLLSTAKRPFKENLTILVSFGREPNLTFPDRDSSTSSFRKHAAHAFTHSFNDRLHILRLRNIDLFYFSFLIYSCSPLLYQKYKNVEIRLPTVPRQPTNVPCHQVSENFRWVLSARSYYATLPSRKVTGTLLMGSAVLGKLHCQTLTPVVQKNK